MSSKLVGGLNQEGLRTCKKAAGVIHKQTTYGRITDAHFNQVGNDVAVDVQVLIDVTPKKIMLLGYRAVRSFFVDMEANTVV